MKPQLPKEIAMFLPQEIVLIIDAFVPHFAKAKKSPSTSPTLQKDLYKIQNMMLKLKGTNTMFLRDLEDFIL